MKMKMKMQEEASESRRPEKDDLFTYLPSEIILKIFLRLPVRAITSCKCVCKSWLDLLMTREFVKSHLSRSIPGLAVFELERHSKPYKIVECVDHSWSIVFSFDFPFRVPMHSSVNGLLFLCKLTRRIEDIFICNPITREYINLPCPLQQPFSTSVCRLVSYGFGVSRKSGQYKVVRGFNKTTQKDYFFLECQVYTVGSGSWRRIAASGGMNMKRENSVGAFLNGNLHWLEDNVARGRTGSRISCLDLETELFSAFSPPPHYNPYVFRNTDRILTVLGDYLCVCHNSRSYNSGIDIWLMKNFGDEKSWTKDYFIFCEHAYLGYVRPIKVFGDGDILMEFGSSRLLYYSNKTKTIQKVDVSSGSENFVSLCCTTIYAPSFVSLKSFAMENVSSF